MQNIHFPTPLHQTVVEDLLTELRLDPSVRGVMLAGSLARGTARPDSDLDVLVVGSGDTEGAPWRRARPLPVDLLVRTAEAWKATFTPDRVDDESWGYTFLEGVILYDPDGVLARLVAEIPSLHTHYRAPTHFKTHYAALWHHLRPKMRAVLAKGDPVEIGWTAAVMANDLVRTAWAVNDLPNPSLDLGTFQRHLDDLTIPPDAPARLRRILRAPAATALRLRLDRLEPHLDGRHENR